MRRPSWLDLWLVLWLSTAVAIPVLVSSGLWPTAWDASRPRRLPWNELAWRMFSHSHNQIPIFYVRDLETGERELASSLVATPSLGYKSSRFIDNAPNKGDYLLYLCSIRSPNQQIDVDIWRRQTEVLAGEPPHRLERHQNICKNQVTPP